MAISLRRLNHFTVGAPSGEEAKVRHFYGELLGLKEIALPETLTKVYEIMWFDMLDFIFHIEFTHQYVRPITWVENGVFMPSRHVALEVFNINDVRKTLTDAGVVIHEAVTLADRDRFYAEDPNGNILELIEFHKDQK